MSQQTDFNDAVLTLLTMLVAMGIAETKENDPGRAMLVDALRCVRNAKPESR